MQQGGAGDGLGGTGAAVRRHGVGVLILSLSQLPLSFFQLMLEPLPMTRFTLEKPQLLPLMSASTPTHAEGNLELKSGLG
jgi:hypothetical protein